MAIDLLRRQSGPDDGRDHEDLGPMLNTVFWTMAALSTIFLALRVYTKVSRRRKMWWDDWLLIASWVRSLFRCEGSKSESTEYADLTDLLFRSPS
jgi:hypothetical protein